MKSKLEARANQATELQHTLAVDSEKFTAARSRMMCVPHPRRLPSSLTHELVFSSLGASSRFGLERSETKPSVWGERRELAELS